MNDINTMLEMARKAMDNAYAPYSGFHVGAVVKATSGKLYAGCNVENAAYPSGSCAEQSAIAAMCLGGDTKIAEILVMGPGDELVTPCGACRQRISEFIADESTAVHICSREAVRKTLPFSELFPYLFTSKNLEDGKKSLDKLFIPKQLNFMITPNLKPKSANKEFLMKEEIKAVAASINARMGEYKPEIAIILGSGLGGLADSIENPVTIPYEELRGFPRSTVKGHAGRLVIGKLGGKTVLCMQGRVHLYEGISPDRIVFLIRTLRKIGIKKVILTNAAGSLRQDMPPGSLMALSDHINFSGYNPLIGPNDEEYGPRFPDMSYAYDPKLRALLMESAEKENANLREGVYLMASGPNFETPAEIRTFRAMGGDAVGMSTVPECLVAVHAGMSVVGVSVITNFGSGMVKEQQSHTETIEQADRAGKKLQRVLARFVKDMK